MLSKTQKIKLKNLVMLNESFMQNFNYQPKDIKISDYDINQTDSYVLFFIIPLDKDQIEFKQGRTIDFDIKEFSDFLESQYEKNDSFKQISTGVDSSVPNPNQNFDFNEVWSRLDDISKKSELKDFILNKIRQLGKIPELS